MAVRLPTAVTPVRGAVRSPRVGTVGRRFGRRRAWAVVLVAAAIAAGCGSGDDVGTAGTAGTAGTTGTTGGASAITEAPSLSPVDSVPASIPGPTGGGVGRCVLSLHGNGGGAQSNWTDRDGIVRLFPGGNARGWGNGRQWLYERDTDYVAARDIVGQALADNGCRRAVLYGYSNGAAFAAKLYCRGESFGITIVGVVIDDPVVDAAVQGCARPEGVKVALYWTGGIDVPPGWDCRANNWTCEGGASIGIAAYEAALGVTRLPSIHTTHRQYLDPPELLGWL